MLLACLPKLFNSGFRKGFAPKLIAQFECKSRDESFKPKYSMIEQYLSNKNESATMLKSKNFFYLNEEIYRVHKHVSGHKS